MSDEVTIGLLTLYFIVTIFVALIMVLGINTSKRKHGLDISYAEAFVLTILWPLLPLCFLVYQLVITAFGIFTWWQDRKS